MPDIVKITVIFALIVFLLRRKWEIGRVMLMASALLSALYLMPPADIFGAVRGALLGDVTIKLALALTSIKVFELILREKNVLARMMDASKAALKNKKAVIVSMPLLIGMLPSVGGAYFSAPMVEESTKGLKLSPEEKGFINYWYRHPWEYILPLYPGIVLASAVSGIEMRRLIAANLSYAVAIAVTGLLFSMKAAKGFYKETPELSKKGFLSMLPIAVVLVLVVVFHVELHYALILSVAGLFAFFRYGARDIARALKHGLSGDVLILIAGIMLFKEIMESSGAVKNISDYLTMKGIPVLSTLFLLPLVSGLLTGLTIGFVGSTFPLLISLLAAHGVSGVSATAAISFAFASGFIGVLLSPVHICFVLTREYFKADMWGIYKKTIPASAIILAVALIQYFILK